MKHHLLLAVLCALFLGACDFDVPVTTRHNVPIDQGLVGFWESVPPEGEELPDAPEEMLILKYSDTEYLVRHVQADSEILFRAYPIKVAGVDCVQLQVLSMGDEVMPDSETDRFTIVSYEMVDGDLVVRAINTELVSGGLQNGRDIQKSIKAHQDHPELFTDATTYRKFKL